VSARRRENKNLYHRVGGLETPDYQTTRGFSISVIVEFSLLGTGYNRAIHHQQAQQPPAAPSSVMISVKRVA